MKIVVATLEPHLRGAVAPQFETAPYFLITDTLVGRTAMFTHPVQFQIECPPARLIHHLREFGPQRIVAGSFSEEVCHAALTQQIELTQVHGRAEDAIARCLDNGGPCAQGRHKELRDATRSSLALYSAGQTGDVP